jgi:bifunctional non-homologous end joining protein LigD
LSAPYTPLRPTRGGTALKFKFTTTGSFIVAGVNASRSVSLRLYDEDSLLGNVTIPPNYPLPIPDSVVEVRYLYCFRGGCLYQPVYLGERDDIGPEECLVAQLKFKREEGDDDGE